MMVNTCPECGAPLPEGASCRDNLNALLALESQLTGEPVYLAHFYAVTSYGLQHPDSMNYNAEALTFLHTALADLLDGRATLEQVRLRMRRAFNGPTRITRRPGEASPPWRRGGWPMNVADVLDVEPSAEAYLERVTQWARSACETISSLGRE